MARSRSLLVLLSVLLLPAVSRGASQIADGPFYFWELERYRIHRSPDLPTGGILPVPDPPGPRGRPMLRGIAWRIDAARAATPTAEEEADGALICDGMRGRVEMDFLWPLARGLRVAAAGRYATRDCDRWESAWLERNLAWSCKRVEFLAGMTRSFWGDGGEGSLLLGRTGPPLDMIRMRSVRPWILPGTREFGRFHASVFLAYLDDGHRTVPYPLLQGTRLEWEPLPYARFSASRTILLGGAGRTERLRLEDAWDIWWARDENRRGTRDHRDTDQKASFGVELRLPPIVSTPDWIRGVRGFYEYGGEDSFEGILPTAVAHHMGGAIDLAEWVVLGEVAETEDDANYWYTNHTVYGPQSYFYHGYVMGHPMGTNSVSAHLRVASPPLGRNRILAWLRGRRHEERGKPDTKYWEEALGCVLGRDVGRLTRLEFGLEAYRQARSGNSAPALPLEWRGILGFRMGGGSFPNLPAAP